MEKIILNLLAITLLAFLSAEAATTIEDFKVGNRILVQFNPDKQAKPWAGAKDRPFKTIIDIQKDADGKDMEKQIKKPICELLLNCSRNEIYSKDKDGKNSRRMGIKRKVEKRKVEKKKVEKKKGCLNCFKPKVEDDQEDEDQEEEEDWEEQDFRDDLHFVYYTDGYLTYCEEPFDQEPKSWYLSGDFSGCLMSVWREEKDGQVMRRVGHVDTNPDWVCDRCKKLAETKSTTDYRGSFYKPFSSWDDEDYNLYDAIDKARKKKRPNMDLFTPTKGQEPTIFKLGTFPLVKKFGLVSNKNEFYLLYVQLVYEWKEGSWVFEIVHRPIKRDGNDLENMPEFFQTKEDKKKCNHPDYENEKPLAVGSSKQNFNRTGTNLFDLDNDDMDDV